MSRRFAADNSEVRYPIQTVSNFTGSCSFALLCDLAVANSVWQNLIVHHKSDGLYAVGYERAGSNTPDALAFEINNSQGTKYGTTTFRASDGWGILGVSRTGTTNSWRAHVYKAGAWTHEAGGTLDNTGNGPSQTGGSIRIGQFEDVDDLDGWIAADAGWAADIGDAGFNALTTNLAIADWVNHATAPAYVHQHNQATASEDIVDLMGNGHTATGTISGTTDSTGIAGTSMDTGNEPPGWTYFGATAKSLPAFDVHRRAMRSLITR